MLRLGIHRDFLQRNMTNVVGILTRKAADRAGGRRSCKLTTVPHRLRYSNGVYVTGKCAHKPLKLGKLQMGG
jgi:hypothetical protein